jgi:hypothetical protein
MDVRLRASVKLCLEEKAYQYCRSIASSNSAAIAGVTFKSQTSSLSTFSRSVQDDCITLSALLVLTAISLPGNTNFKPLFRSSLPSNISPIPDGRLCVSMP